MGAIPLNISFAVMAFVPTGWIFMVFIILIECLAMSRLLLHKWYDTKIYLTAFATNVISGLVGMGATLLLNNWWWLVIWFPWVSTIELNVSRSDHLLIFALYYVCAFVLTCLIEGIVNQAILKKDYEKRAIWKTTLLTNGISYLVGSGIMYSISFDLLPF